MNPSAGMPMPRKGSSRASFLSGGCYISAVEPLFLFLFFFILLFRDTPKDVEVPRLGVEVELQLWAYTTATARQDLSHIFNLYCSSWQCHILNPLRKARD